MENHSIWKLLDKIKNAYPDQAKVISETLLKQGFGKKDIQEIFKMDIQNGYQSIDKIPTLIKGVYKKTSPMLEVRFKHSGSWNLGGDRWLNIEEMEGIFENKKVMRHLKSHKEHWENSAAMSYSFEQLSLFGFVEGAEEDQIYVVWGASNNKEPEIWTYRGMTEEKYLNLEEYLKSLIE